MELIVSLAIVIITIVVCCSLANSDGGESNRPSRSQGRRPPNTFETLFPPEHKRAGMRGETIASNAILSIMRDEDRLYTNVSVCYDERPTELDAVVVNRYGVFIIEVKNYSGVIYGDEDDYEWQKYKKTNAGSVFVKTVRNPIKQVKRQTYLLARYLEERGVNVWVNGYAILVQDNSPVESDYILKSVNDIDRAVHSPGRKTLSPKTLDAICHALVQNCI